MDIQKTYAMVLGGVLVLVGLLGFIQNPLVGETALFGANALQSVVHILGGAAGLWFGYKGGAKNYNTGLGGVGLLLAVLGFVPATGAILASTLAVNQAITMLHAAIGAVSLGVAFGIKEE